MSFVAGLLQVFSDSLALVENANTAEKSKIDIIKEDASARFHVSVSFVLCDKSVILIQFHLLVWL